MNDKKIQISIVMPALNEEENIRTAIDNTLSALDDFKINGEVIVVNDGSTDKTGFIVDEIAKNYSRIRMYTHQSPQGIGASFWEGVDNAYGDAVVIFPADDENDPNEIFRYYRLLEHVDIVIPFIFNREARPLFRNLLSLVYRLIINATFVVNFNYTNGTVLYRKSILKELDHRSRGFFFQTDILIRSVKKGYLFAEVPYRLKVRKCGDSKAVTFPSFLQVAKGYFRLIKDYYFKKNKDSKLNFTADSLTTIRRKTQENAD